MSVTFLNCPRKCFFHIEERCSCPLDSVDTTMSGIYLIRFSAALIHAVVWLFLQKDGGVLGNLSNECHILCSYRHVVRSPLIMGISWYIKCCSNGGVSDTKRRGVSKMLKCWFWVVQWGRDVHCCLRSWNCSCLADRCHVW